MAISSEDKTQLLKVIVGLFNAAPGNFYLPQVEKAVEDGMPVSDLAQLLAGKSIFTDGVMGAATTPAEQAAILTSHFGLTADDVEGSPASKAITHFTTGIEAGINIGTLVYNAVVFLEGQPADSPFASVATLLANKALAASIYSDTFGGTDLAALQAVLSAVTGDTLYDEAAAKQALIDGGVVFPSTFTIAASAASLSEGGTLTFTVSSDKPVTEDTEVVFTLVAGDTTAADQGTDTTNLNDFASGAFNPVTVIIPAGSTTATHSISGVSDNITELAESFSIKAVVGGTTTLTANSTLLDSGVQTFLLKVGEDNLPGTGGDDLFVAPIVQDNVADPRGTLESFDSLNGGEGNDTLTATIFNTIPAPVLNSVENVNVRFTDAAGGINLANATGVNVVTVQNSTTEGVVQEVGDIATLKVSNQVQDVNFTESTAKTLNIGLTSFGDLDGAANTVDLASAGAAAVATTINYSVKNSNATIQATTATTTAATISIAATGENKLTLSDDDSVAKKVTVTGTGSVDLSNGVAFTGDLATFDASANEGGVEANIQSAVKVAVTGGSGDDVIRMDTTVVGDSTVSLGNGQDALYVGALLANFASANGGDGDGDIINITDSTTFTADNLANVSGFEVLDVSGATNAAPYDLSLKSFDTVQIDEAVNGALVAAVTLDDAANGFVLKIMSEAETGANFAVGADVIINVENAATGTTDSVSLDFTINDGDESNTAQGITTAGITVAEVETINIVSNVGQIDGGDDIENHDHITTVATLTIDDAKTLNVSGDSSVVITTLANANNTLSKINASGSQGDVAIDASGLGASVNYSGAEGTDTYVASGFGDTINTAGGADDVTLGAGEDVFVIKAAADSQIVDTNEDGELLLDGNDEGFDMITGFSIASDKIDLLTFAFAGSQRGLVDVSSTVDATTDLTSVVDLFDSAGGDRGAAIYDDGTDIYIFIDANKDGDFTAADDAIIQLSGSSGLAVSASDFNI